LVQIVGWRGHDDCSCSRISVECGESKDWKGRACCAFKPKRFLASCEVITFTCGVARFTILFPSSTSHKEVDLCKVCLRTSSLSQLCGLLTCSTSHEEVEPWDLPWFNPLAHILLRETAPFPLQCSHSNSYAGSCEGSGSPKCLSSTMGEFVLRMQSAIGRARWSRASSAVAM